MKLLPLLLATVLVVDEDVLSISLVFEKMHCDECKATVEAQLRQTHKNAKVTVEGDTATVTIPEGTALDLSKIHRALPSDLKLKSIGLTARGTVTAKGADFKFQPRNTASEYPLVNRDEKPKAKDDRLAELRKELGGKNRFEITGELREKDKLTQLIVTGFKKTDWADK